MPKTVGSGFLMKVQILPKGKKCNSGPNCAFFPLSRKHKIQENTKFILHFIGFRGDTILPRTPITINFIMYSNEISQDYMWLLLWGYQICSSYLIWRAKCDGNSLQIPYPISQNHQYIQVEMFHIPIWHQSYYFSYQHQKYI